MSELEQLEQRVQNLSDEDFAKFREWFLELENRLWDKQIAQEVEAGELDGLIHEAMEDFKAGRAREISRQAALEEVRRRIAVGLEQAERGELLDGEEVIREILKKL